MKLVLASGNPGKLAEMRDLLVDARIDLVAQSELGISDADETGSSFVENALLKARHAARASNLPALADDSGLCVDALGGAPGLLSARYAGEHGNARANIAKLLDALKHAAPALRTAHFYCCIVLLRRADDPAPLIAEGRWPGHIALAPYGDNGFGYDPIFLPDNAGGLSAAALQASIKNRISHRGQALTKLHDVLFANCF